MNQILSNKNIEINLMEIMINILCSYLRSIKDEYIKLISNTIMNNFILYKQKMIIKKIKRMFIIYSKQELLTIKEKLSKWEQKALNISKNNSKIDFENNQRDNYFNLNLNVGPIMNNSHGIPIIINNNNNNSNNNNNLNNSHINKSNVSINQINKENDFQINKTLNLNYKNKKNLFKYNYHTINNSISYFSTIQKGKIRSYSSEAPERNTNYISIDHKKEKDLIYQKMRRNRYGSEKIVNKFIKRQENYKISNFQKKKKIIKDFEEINKLIYTFEPKVNDNLRKLYKKDNISASNRLYNDSIVRKNKKLENQSISNTNSKIAQKKSFNKNKYIELYEDSKIRKEKKEELIKKIEKECGYTYAPTILHKNIDIKNNGEDIKKNLSMKNKENKSLSKSKINKENKIKNLKKCIKNNSCIKLISKQKKEIKKNEVKRSNGKKIKGISK